MSTEQKFEPLSECVRNALTQYFAQMGSHPPTDLYDLVLRQVERPLLECVLEQAGGNQTRGAQMLGVSRSTLRKKLKMYGLAAG